MNNIVFEKQKCWGLQRNFVKLTLFARVVADMVFGTHFTWTEVFANNFPKI